MTKTELENPETRQALKKEIMAEIKQDARRRRLLNCLGCLTLELLAVLIPLVFVAVLLARTGLVQVPLLTSWLYRPVAPSRTVLPLAGSNTADILIAEISKPKVNPNFGTFKISFNESELTTMAKDGLNAAGDSLPLKVDSVQVAVDADAVELFATSPQKGRAVTIRIRFVPNVDGGKLKLTINELKIGSLDVPPGASGMLATLLDKSLASAMESGIGQLGQLVNIELAKGFLRVEIVPKNKLLP